MTPEETARRVFDEALRRKATAAELYFRASRRTSTRVRALELESYASEDDAEAGVRVFRGRRWGLAHTTILEAGALRRAVRVAAELAEAADEDPHARLADSAPRAPGECPAPDPALAAMTREERIGMALDVERGAFGFDRRVTSSRYVSFSEERSSVFLANTRGLEARREEAGASLFGMFAAGEGGARQQIFGSDASRRLGRLDPRGLGESVARRLVACLGGSPPPTGRRDVVLDPSASSALAGALASALNGEQVHLERSFLRGRVGERVASPVLTIVDDPEACEEEGSAPWDDEGTVSRRKVLVRGGVLEGFLYDLASASMAGTTTTGNGFRPGPGSPPRALPSHFAVEPGRETLESLVAGVEEGLYVAGFMGRGFDPASGRLSAPAIGARIRNGRLAEPVAGAILTGPLEAFLKGIDAAGDRVERAGNLAAPALRVRGVMVAGR